MLQTASQMLKRAQRAFGGADLSQVKSRYRAVVGPTRSQDELVETALKKLQGSEIPTPKELAALEQAIRAYRPSVLVRDGAAEDLPPEAAGAFSAWSQFVKDIKQHMRAIGRIDHELGHNVLAQDSVGTGFLVSRSLLLTNCHVLDALSMGHRVLEQGQAIVRFKHEYQTADEDPVPISRVAAFDSGLDLAALELGAGLAEDGRQPLEFDSSAIPIGTAVVAIGYPFPDDERNPLFVSTVFSDQHFGVKRAAPGEVIGSEDAMLFHDCSTLGGNSGSPIVSIQTAKVVGVHRAGGFANRNEAVDPASLSKFVHSLI